MIAHDNRGFFWSTWFTEQMRRDAYEETRSPHYPGIDTDALAFVDLMWPRAYTLTPPVIPQPPRKEILPP